jgi:hypothetical protein
MTRARALSLALALLLFDGVVAGQHDGKPPPSMPDPCSVAPMLPFCRSELPT